MFETYAATVVIYMIIIYCMNAIFNDAIKQMGWKKADKEKSSLVKALAALFFVSAVPVLRVAFIVFIMYMATHTKEEFEEWQEEAKKNK